jgi:PncC family amidohydrolase
MIEAADGFRVDVALRYPDWFDEGRSLEADVVRALTELGRTVATAESITGGGIADALVRVPGASRCFRGGVTAYADALKTDLVGVDAELLRTHGAVSEQVAAAMARGARERMGADFALATTGIAGPTGATEGKPIGLTWFALALPTGAVDTYSMTFPGERDDVRRAAVRCGLRFLRRGVDASC